MQVTRIAVSSVVEIQGRLTALALQPVSRQDAFALNIRNGLECPK